MFVKKKKKFHELSFSFSNLRLFFHFYFFYFLFGGGKSVCSNFKVLMLEVFSFFFFLLYSRIGGVYFAYYKFVFNHVLVLGYFTLSLFVAQLLLI